MVIDYYSYKSTDSSRKARVVMHNLSVDVDLHTTLQQV